ncbi:MAG: hypothetical protein KDC38_00890 [Planctomycetes bacterium]|nr:hypothetical protein [Planctomycetota bacterium]
MALGLALCCLVSPARAQSGLYVLTLSGFSDFQIRRFDLDGANPTTVISQAGVATPTSIAIDEDAEFLYWENFLGIQRSNLDGSGATTVAPLLPPLSVTGFTLDSDAGLVYFMCLPFSGSSQPQGVYRCNLDGSGVTFIAPVGNPGAVEILVVPQSDLIFLAARWPSLIAPGIWRMGTDGSGLQQILTGTTLTAGSVAVDTTNNHIYAGVGGQLVRANFDGSDLIVLGVAEAQSIAVDLSVGKIYYGDAVTNQTRMTNLDGTDDVALFSPAARSLTVLRPRFVRGDVNRDGVVELSDMITLLEALFTSASLSCLSAGDVNDDGAFDISDAIYGLSWLFSGGAPIPEPTTCDFDPTPSSPACRTSNCP